MMLAHAIDLQVRGLPGGAENLAATLRRDFPEAHRALREMLGREDEG